jgi:hypothetical protein
MAEERIEHIGTFTAQDENGKSYTIYVYSRVFDYESSHGHQKVEGVSNLRTSDGDPVRRIDKGKYQLDNGFTRVDLVSDDPDAP